MGSKSWTVPNPWHRAHAPWGELNEKARGVISARDAAEAKREPVPTRRRPVPRLAPHLARDLVAADPTAKRIETTLDAEWQARLEAQAWPILNRMLVQQPKVLGKHFETLWNVWQKDG